MRRLFVLVFLVFLLNEIKSQEITYRIPDYDLIKNDISDSTSDFYYPKLLSRLTGFDTTLTNEDYRHLYYGYIFQKNYQPYWISPDEKELLKYYKSSDINKKDFDKIIQLTTHSINEFPFDLRQMNFLGYIYHLSGDEENAKKVYYRFSGTMDAIMSSGNGKTCEAGFHVISVSHEYVLLNFFEFHMKSQALMGDCDYLTLEKDQRNVDGIYFNIKKLFEKNMEEMKKK